jgi:dTDP-4-dehydrorhamnose reductase
MRYLIFGKDGMLGRDLIHTFGREDLFAFGIEDVDITNANAVNEKLITVQPNVVINATGYTNVDFSEVEQEKANQINGYAVGNLAKCCRDIDATLVHFSSDYVFNGENKKGYGEDDATDPVNAYGLSKARGEKLLTEEMELINDTSQKEGSYFIIRTSWLYGRHGKNFVDTMLSMAKKRRKIEVVNDQFGKPTYTVDLCRQVKWLIESKEYPSGIYHITNDEVTCWYDFAKEIFKVSKIKVDVFPCSSNTLKREAKRPRYSSLINSKLPPLRTWHEALREYLTNLK